AASRSQRDGAARGTMRTGASWRRGCGEAWRKGWDSNPRYGLTVHRISSPAHSTTLPPFRARTRCTCEAREYSKEPLLQGLRDACGASAEALDAAHVRHERRRQAHRPVGLLPVLE